MGFDYWDDIFHLGMSVRIGRVGIVICLQDGGAVKMAAGEYYLQYEKLRLHWMQFAEITAMIFNDLHRFEYVPKFMLVEGDGRVQVAMSPLGGFGRRPLFAQASIEQYARVLAHCTRLPLETVHPKADLVMTWLREDGKLKQMNADDPA